MIWFMNRKSGCLRFLKTKEHKNKSYALNVIMYVQASLTYITTLNVEHLRCIDSYSTFFCKEEQKKWVYTNFIDRRT